VRNVMSTPCVIESETKKNDAQSISGKNNVAMALSRVCHLCTKSRGNPRNHIVVMCDSTLVEHRATAL
jgi:hypothetical protein